MKKVKVPVMVYSYVPECDKCGNLMKAVQGKYIDVQVGKYWFGKPKMKSEWFYRWVCVNCNHEFFTQDPEYGQIKFCVQGDCEDAN